MIGQKPGLKEENLDRITTIVGAIKYDLAKLIHGNLTASCV